MKFNGFKTSYLGKDKLPIKIEQIESYHKDKEDKLRIDPLEGFLEEHIEVLECRFSIDGKYRKVLEEMKSSNELLKIDIKAELLKEDCYTYVRIKDIKIVDNMLKVEAVRKTLFKLKENKNDWYKIWSN